MNAALGKSLDLAAMPGIKAGTFGRPFAGYQGIYVTNYADNRGKLSGALKFAIQYMGSAKVQAKLTAIGHRPAANKAAAAAIKNTQIQGLINSGSYGILQRDLYLGNNAGGSNYWDLVGDVFDKVLNKGEDVKGTFDAAAAILLADWAAAK